MSSIIVRNKVTSYLKAILPGMEVFDFDSYYKDSELNEDYLIIKFGISEEDRIGIPDRFREEGRVLINYITSKKNDMTTPLTSVEGLRNLLRDTNRIDNLIEVLNVGTPKFGTADSIKLVGPKKGITFYIDYRFNFTKEIAV